MRAWSKPPIRDTGCCYHPLTALSRICVPDHRRDGDQEAALQPLRLCRVQGGSQTPALPGAARGRSNSAALLLPFPCVLPYGAVGSSCWILIIGRVSKGLSRIKVQKHDNPTALRCPPRCSAWWTFAIRSGLPLNPRRNRFRFSALPFPRTSAAIRLETNAFPSFPCGAASNTGQHRLTPFLVALLQTQDCTDEVPNTKKRLCSGCKASSAM